MPAPKDPEKYQKYIERLSTSHKGKFTGEKNPMFGKTGTLNPFFGKKHSDVTLEKIRKAKSNIKRSESTIKKMADALRGKPLTKSHRDNLSSSLRGRIIPQKTRDAIAQSNRDRAGEIRSEVTRVKIAESRLIGGMWYGNVRYSDRPVYCEKWTENLRERVRAFRNYRCFECGVPQGKTKLPVHHIHYNKKTCCDKSPHDMVPLCQSCHSKTNIDRDFWEKHLTEKLYATNQDGKCFFTKEEMSIYEGKV